MYVCTNNTCSIIIIIISCFDSFSIYFVLVKKFKQQQENLALLIIKINITDGFNWKTCLISWSVKHYTNWTTTE